MLRSLNLLLIFLAVSLFGFQAGPAKSKHEGLIAGENVLWTDPGDVASFDFRYGIGAPEGQPQPPFEFMSEDFSGTSRKINVRDARGTNWNMKWGHETRPSVFCSRLLWACGYMVETEYFLPQGHIDNVHELQRAASEVAKDGSFVNARFQLRSGSPKYLSGRHWTWTKNPFVGTPQLRGLKLLLLLVSNWDAKEQNNSIFEDNSSGALRYLYIDVDWGASLGKWGNTFTWKKWDCSGFAQQTSHFVKRDANGSLHWGFAGKNAKALTSDISVQDVQWLLQYLGKITDEQIRTGLAASGATPEDVKCFAPSLRQRIEQLQQVSTASTDGLR